MKLPQDRILHIDTEIIDGKVNITAEWQGELVRCKDCKWHMDDYMGEEWCGKLSGLPGMKADDFCSYGERKGGDAE